MNGRDNHRYLHLRIQNLQQVHRIAIDEGVEVEIVHVAFHHRHHHLLLSNLPIIADKVSIDRHLISSSQHLRLNNLIQTLMNIGLR